MDQKEAREELRKAGFNRHEIHRLMKFRKKFLSTNQFPTETTNRRLEFARWLFVTGKLTDLSPETLD